MAQNIFEELLEKKSKLAFLAGKAKEYGWIDANREKEIVEKLNNDVLTIGVIGQMKCGKSTFLNSFVFENDVLPAAVTPMTAALSVITYGPKEKVVAEFYTKDEWEEQKMQASRSLEEVAGNTLEESKVKAAKELVEKSGKLGSTLNTLLGKTQEDSFNNLIEYVGADGKYVSITKSVIIYYPKNYLKGVEIVDTPGFNDPIVSREERTKEFLKRADVVLLMLYAGRPFDATDRDILFKNVRQCGTGKVLIGVNKYDIPYGNGESENMICDYVKSEIRKACRECDDNTLVEILKETEPIPLSAEMALLSEIPMSKITSNEAFSFAWKRHCDTFEISNQSQMRTKSHLDDLVNAVKKIIETEKEEILFRKPLNAILSAGNKRKEEIEKGIRENQMLVSNLSKPDDEIEEIQNNLSKANRRLNKKINGLGDDIDSEFNDLIRKGRNEMEDSVDASCKRMDSIIESLGRFQSAEGLIPKLEAEVQTLITRTLKRNMESIGKEAKTKMRRCVTEFMTDAEDILMRFVPDFDSRDFIKGIDRSISMEILDNDVFSYEASDSSEYGLSDFLFDFLNGASWGVVGLLGNALSHGDSKRNMHQCVLEIRSNVDLSEVLDSVFRRKDEVIEEVKTKFITELIEPLQQQIEQIMSNKANKEQQLKDAQSKLDQLNKDKEQITKQLETIK